MPIHLIRAAGTVMTAQSEHVALKHRRYAGLVGVAYLLSWSGWPDLNRRPLRPERSALPSCATPRPRGTSTGTARDFDSLAEARACSRIARQSASQTPNGLVRLARRQGEQGS